jgi:hypothetical protein
MYAGIRTIKILFLKTAGKSEKIKLIPNEKIPVFDSTYSINKRQDKPNTK